MKDWIFCSLVPFMCGGVVVGNLTRLIATNPNYEASWINVAIAIAMAIVIPSTHKWIGK